MNSKDFIFIVLISLAGFLIFLLGIQVSSNTKQAVEEATGSNSHLNAETAITGDPVRSNSNHKQAEQREIVGLIDNKQSQRVQGHTRFSNQLAQQPVVEPVETEEPVVIETPTDDTPVVEEPSIEPEEPAVDPQPPVVVETPVEEPADLDPYIEEREILSFNEKKKVSVPHLSQVVVADLTPEQKAVILTERRKHLIAGAGMSVEDVYWHCHTYFNELNDGSGYITTRTGFRFACRKFDKSLFNEEQIWLDTFDRKALEAHILKNKCIDRCE